MSICNILTCKTDFYKELFSDKKHMLSWYGLIRKFSVKCFVMRCHMLISPIISFSVDFIIYAIFDEDLSRDLSARTSYERPKFISR